jgi:hypothetical protein
MMFRRYQITEAAMLAKCAPIETDRIFDSHTKIHKEATIRVSSFIRSDVSLGVRNEQSFTKYAALGNWSRRSSSPANDRLWPKAEEALLLSETAG